MPHFSRHQLGSIAEALRNQGFSGMANEVWWWNDTTRKAYRKRESYRAMYRPLKEMPLFLESGGTNAVIAETRLKLES